VREATIKKLVGIELLQADGKTLSLTRKGLLLADSIAAELFLYSHDL
jgi:coproporphyrinogen III oxidase-like Fe-S oxidoreductase